MKPRRIVLFGAAALLLALGFLSALEVFAIRRYERTFDRLTAGSTEAQLTAEAGMPSYVTDGTRWVEPTSAKTADQLVPGCVKELWYDYPWLVRKDAYCFSGQGVLLAKYDWTSW